MTTITQDDVGVFEDVLAAIDATEDDLRDLVERMRRKGDLDRVAELRQAITTLGLARRKVQEQLR